MPELPEVQTVVQSLLPRVAGKAISAVRLLRDDIVSPAGFDLTAKLANRRIETLTRRAKRIIFHLDDGNRFYIHLGMSGRLTLEPPEAALLKHTHLILSIGNGEIRFVDPRRFGGVFWLGADDPGDGDLGPEPLTLRAGELIPRLRKTNRAIKTALLDQKLIAGLGNIYADEALFDAHIHPRTPANRLSDDQIKKLNGSIKTVLKRAIHHRGSTLRDYRDADGNPGNFQRIHRVYDRAGQPCLVCQTPITRIVLGGRSTHFCKHCQPRKAAVNAPSGKPARKGKTPSSGSRTP